MVKLPAVIIPLALATVAYLFYSQHKGNAASTASRNESPDKDYKADKSNFNSHQLGNSGEHDIRQNNKTSKQLEPLCEEVLAKLTFLIKKQLLVDGFIDLSKLDPGLLELLHLTRHPTTQHPTTRHSTRKHPTTQNKTSPVPTTQPSLTPALTTPFKLYRIKTTPALSSLTSKTPAEKSVKISIKPDKEFSFEQDISTSEAPSSPIPTPGHLSAKKLLYERPSTLASTPADSLTNFKTQPSIPKPKQYIKINYETDDEVDFKTLLHPSTLVPSSTTVKIETKTGFNFKQEEQTEQSIYQSSTTSKPPLEILNYERKNEVNFKQDVTKKQKEQIRKTSASKVSKVPVFTSKTKKSTKKFSTITRKSSLEKLKYKSENQVNFEKNKTPKQEKEQIRTSSPKLQTFTPTERSINSTTKKPAARAQIETKKEFNFKEQEEQTERSISHLSTTYKSSLEQLNYKTENEVNFEQDENIKKQEEQIRTSSLSVQKLPIFTPTTEKPAQSPSTIFKRYRKIQNESDQEFNFETQDNENENNKKVEHQTKVDIRTDQSTEKNVEREIEKINNEKSVENKTVQAIESRSKFSSSTSKIKTSTIKIPKKTTTKSATVAKGAFRYKTEKSFEFGGKGGRKGVSGFESTEKVVVPAQTSESVQTTTENTFLRINAEKEYSYEF